MEKYLITFLFLILLTLGFKASADTQEALDVAKEKGLVDLTQATERIEVDLEKNTEFRIKWPRGEMGTLPADSEQYMLIEHIAGQVEKIQKRMENMMNNGVNINRLQKDVESLTVAVEALKDSNRNIIYSNGNSHKKTGE